MMKNFLVFLVTRPTFSIWHGYVLTNLWGWFVVPTFGFPQIGIAQAIGVSVFVRYVTYRRADLVAPRDAEGTDQYVYPILVPLGALCIGWVVRQFM